MCQGILLLSQIFRNLKIDCLEPLLKKGKPQDTDEIPSVPGIRNSKDSPEVPESIRTANRDEHQNIQLKIIDGKLSSDMQGHVFIITSVGNVDSNGLPYQNGDSLLCGDGMIYRLDFCGEDNVRLTTRLVKPPDYYADELTSKKESKYYEYRFSNHGTVRFSPVLGVRNQLNTAFLPMKFSQNSLERLLITYDAGRPYEIDTENLMVINPVGYNKEWQSETGDNFDFPFPVFLSTAHPAFDYDKKEMFTVNYGRSIQNLSSFITSNSVGQFPRDYNLLKNIQNALQDIFMSALDLAVDQFLFFIAYYFKNIKKDPKSEIGNFVHLMRWDGENRLKRWKLLLPDGSPVQIRQTIHQIGVTKNYVVIMDTCYRVGLEEVINNPFPQYPEFERLFRQRLDPLPLPNTALYIVPRNQLNDGNIGKGVKVKKVVLPLEAAHFLVDYDNHNPDNPEDENIITLHTAHICGMKVSDWIREYDKSAYSNRTLEDVSGLVPGQADIGSMGRYVINGDTGNILKSYIISDSKYTWGTDLYTYRELDNAGKPLTQLSDIYWCSFGLWKDLMTESIITQYKDYKNRQVPLETVLKMAKDGVRSSLFRISNEQSKGSQDKSLVIADQYELPEGYVLLSPQFMPRSRDNTSINAETKISIDGYIICPVWYETKNEFWIFDAADLKKGPLCKLASSCLHNLDFPMTLHTAWLPQIGEHQTHYCINVRKDYRDLVSKASKKNKGIEELFKDIYERFESSKPSK